MRSRDFRSIFGVVATLHEAGSFNRKRYGRENYAIGGRDWGPRYDGELPVSLSNWRFVCKDCSCGLRCNYNLSILLTFFGVIKYQ